MARIFGHSKSNNRTIETYKKIVIIHQFIH